MPEIPDFTDRAWQHTRTDVQLRISILEGKNQHMPANRQMVSDDLARQLVGYVRAFAPEAPRVAAAPPRVPAAPAVPTPPPVKGSAGSTTLAAIPPYTPSGDFDVDMDALSRRLEIIKGQMQQLDSQPARTTVAPPAVSPPAAPPVAVVPSVSPPPAEPSAVPTPPATASSGQPIAAPPEKPQIAAVPISDRPFTAEDVVRGKELFLGRRPLANGGQACVACHAVNLDEARQGGRLGPQLTKAFERVGGRTALCQQLWAPSTPTMRPAYRQHSLESDEVLALAAYLEHADRTAAEDSAPLSPRVLLWSLGGTVLGLVTIGALWGGRARQAGDKARAVP
jgi:mono/diheme cytochrome c family protein